jgi:hypothetical protein
VAEISCGPSLAPHFGTPTHSVHPVVERFRFNWRRPEEIARKLLGMLMDLFVFWTFLDHFWTIFYFGCYVFACFALLAFVCMFTVFCFVIG